VFWFASPRARQVYVPVPALHKMFFCAAVASVPGFTVIEVTSAAE
jgi:hypothetical protein